MKSTNIILILLLLLTSCQKLSEDYNKIPEDEPRLSDLQKKYQEMLAANLEGWFMEYQPGPDNPSVPVLMKFSKDGTVLIISDRQGFEEERQSTYRIGGVIGPELIFDTYSVYSSIAESGGGMFDFRMYPQENGDFILKHATGGLETEFTLRRAQSGDRLAIEERAAVGNLLKDFNRNATAYFKNLILANVSAFWEIDVEAQKLTLTWENAPGGATATQTFGYTTLPGNGIRLAQPWKTSSVEVQEIFFGEAKSDGIEVVEAGNAGSGDILVSHVPPFPYKGTAKRFIWSNSFNPNQTPVRFFASVSGTRETSIAKISPALWPYYENLWKAETWPGFLRMQVYNYNAPTFNNSIQFLGNLNDKTEFLAYYYALDLIDESHVSVRKSNEVPTDHPHYRANYSSGVALSMYNSHPEFAEFLDRIYPPEGVTIVPLSGQNVRVVSRANSLYYFDLSISTPATFWTN